MEQLYAILKIIVDDYGELYTYTAPLTEYYTDENAAINEVAKKLKNNNDGYYYKIAKIDLLAYTNEVGFWVGEIVRSLNNIYRMNKNSFKILIDDREATFNGVEWNGHELSLNDDNHSKIESKMKINFKLNNNEKIVINFDRLKNIIKKSVSDIDIEDFYDCIRSVFHLIQALRKFYDCENEIDLKPFIDFSLISFNEEGIDRDASIELIKNFILKGKI